MDKTIITVLLPVAAGWRKMALIVVATLMLAVAQAQVSPEAFTPCQEMPNLIQNYQADYEALVRFYNGAFYGTRQEGHYGTAGGSPEKRGRLDALYHEYLQKLDHLDFEHLPQECKVDWLLFRRQLREKLRASTAEDTVYQNLKKWFPFADSIYAAEKLRRRGHPPDAQRLAKNWFDYSRTISTLNKKTSDRYFPRYGSPL